MSKPLLTDELIERYRQGEDLEDLLHEQELKTGYTVRIEDLDIDYMVKSRRIENAKRAQFRRRLNRILVLLVLLLAGLIYAIFYL